MFHKSAYYHEQYVTTSNRYRAYIHFSGASQSARRRGVNGQIASYFQEIIFLPRKRSHPSISYLYVSQICILPRTTYHNIKWIPYLYPLLRAVSKCSPPRKRPNRKLFPGNNLRFGRLRGDEHFETPLRS